MCIIMYKCVCLREKSGSSSVSNTLVINHGPQQALSTRWSGYAALEGEQLDEWQLYVEGRERANGFLGEEMVCVGRGTAGRVAIVR
jgi:hypothetical protein